VDGIAKTLGPSEAWWANDRVVIILSIFFCLGICLLIRGYTAGRKLFCRAAAVCGYACEPDQTVGETTKELTTVEFRILFETTNIAWHWLRCAALLFYLSVAMLASSLILCLNHPWLFSGIAITMTVLHCSQDTLAEIQNN
jgi:hypothetical protein